MSNEVPERGWQASPQQEIDDYLNDVQGLHCVIHDRQDIQQAQTWVTPGIPPEHGELDLETGSVNNSGSLVDPDSWVASETGPEPERQQSQNAIHYQIGQHSIRKQIPHAPLWQTELPYHLMTDATIEELVVYFPEHVMTWPGLALLAAHRFMRDEERGWTAQIAHLINNPRGLTKGQPGYISRGDVRNWLRSTLRQWLGKEYELNYAAHDAVLTAMVQQNPSIHSVEGLLHHYMWKTPSHLKITDPEKDLITVGMAIAIHGDGSFSRRVQNHCAGLTGDVPRPLQPNQIHPAVRAFSRNVNLPNPLPPQKNALDRTVYPGHLTPQYIMQHHWTNLHGEVLLYVLLTYNDAELLNEYAAIEGLHNEADKKKLGARVRKRKCLALETRAKRLGLPLEQVQEDYYQEVLKAGVRKARKPRKGKTANMAQLSTMLGTKVDRIKREEMAAAQSKRGQGPGRGQRRDILDPLHPFFRKVSIVEERGNSPSENMRDSAAVIGSSQNQGWVFNHVAKRYEFISDRNMTMAARTIRNPSQSYLPGSNVSLFEPTKTNDLNSQHPIDPGGKLPPLEPFWTSYTTNTNAGFDAHAAHAKPDSSEPFCNKMPPLLHSPASSDLSTRKPLPQSYGGPTFHMIGSEQNSRTAGKDASTKSTIIRIARRGSIEFMLNPATTTTPTTGRQEPPIPVKQSLVLPRPNQTNPRPEEPCFKPLKLPGFSRGPTGNSPSPVNRDLSVGRSSLEAVQTMPVDGRVTKQATQDVSTSRKDRKDSLASLFGSSSESSPTTTLKPVALPNQSDYHPIERRMTLSFDVIGDSSPVNEHVDRRSGQRCQFEAMPSSIGNRKRSREHHHQQNSGDAADEDGEELCLQSLDPPQKRRKMDSL